MSLFNLFYFFFMNRNFDAFPISPQNCINFNTNTFDLSMLYEELHNFYNNVGLGNEIYYAHIFNKNGLFYNPYPIKGYQTKKSDFDCIIFNLFSDKDITFTTDLVNDNLNHYITSLYKYNILCLYDSIQQALKGYDNGYNSLFYYNNIEKEVEFYIFISRHCINKPEFDKYRLEYIKNYISL